MERKFRSQKKAILILAIVCVLVIAAIVYLQVRIGGVKADTTSDMEAQLTELTAERDAAQAEFDAKDYSGTVAAKKDEVKALEDQKKELLATPEPTPEPTEEPTPEPTEKPTPEPTEEPTPEPTAE